MKHRMCLVWILAVGTGLCACNRDPTADEETPSAEGPMSTDADPTRLAKAAARGAAAARAYVRQRGLAPAPSPSQIAKAPAVHTPIGGNSEDAYAEIDWLAMIPPDDLEALKNAAPVLHSGSRRMPQFGSYKTVPTVVGRKVKLPGYVVPIGMDDDAHLEEFFFVPYFGACVHVPPPPPNQLIYVTLDKPIPVPEMWAPYWLRGELAVEISKNEMADSAYRMKSATLQPYEG